MSSFPWSLTTRRINDVTIVHLTGRFTLGGSVSEFEAAVTGALAQGVRSFLVNLGEVTYIDSAGIGKLTFAMKSAIAAGGSLKLVNVNQRVAGLLKLTGVYPVFEIFRDESVAVASFSAVA